MNWRPCATLAALMFSSLSPGYPQVDMSGVNAIMDSFMRGAELGARQRYLDEQIRIQREQLRLLQLQNEQLEKLRLDREKLARGEPPSRTPDFESAQPTPTESEQQTLSKEIDAALAELRRKYKDFGTYEQPITRVMALFHPAKGSSLSVRDYLEGLYVIAKHASFAKTFSRESQPPLK